MTGSVTGIGGAPLDSMHIELTVPSQLMALYAIVGGVGRDRREGRILGHVALMVGPGTRRAAGHAGDLHHRHRSAAALHPAAGRVGVRDSVFVPVAMAPSGSRCR